MVDFGLFERVNEQLQDIGVGNVCQGVHIEPVGNASAHHSRLEARRLCHGPRREKATVAPATDGESISVDQSLRDQVIDAEHDILEVFAADVSHHRVGKSRTIAPTAPVVNAQHSVASRGKYLRVPGSPASDCCRRWASTHIDKERRWWVACVVDRERKERVDSVAVYGGVVDVLGDRPCPGILWNRVEACEPPPLYARNAAVLVYQLPTVHIGRLLWCGMDGDKSAQIGCRRGSGLIPARDEVAVEHRDGPIKYIQNAELVAYPVNGGIEQAPTIGEPGTPRRATRNAGSQVARCAVFQREQVDVTRSTPRIAPFPRKIGQLLPVR